jgi:CHAT domain-containing protein
MWTSAGAAEAGISPVQALATPGANLAGEGAQLGEAVTRCGAAALSYLMTDDTLLVWLIEPSGEVAVARQPVSRDSVARLVRALRAGLGVDDATAGAQLALRGALELETPAETEGGAPLRRGLRYAETAAEALAALLLPAELASRLPESGELVIVPQGPLALVPFSALPLGDTGQVTEFGNRFAIRYAPSLATLDLAEARPAVGSGPERVATLSQAVVVGNPRMPEVTAATGERRGLAPLPRAEGEAAWLAERLGIVPLTGAEATESAVRDALAGNRLAHLATHGYAYSTESQARQSFVALAADEQHDGLLTVGEILDDPALELDAELVVLSACQTGLGDLKEAEGTVGLQRAFLARGARSVLVSLWSVSDVVTEELMKRFYSHWLEDEDGPSKAEALRRAQVEVRRTPGWEHPRYWAAFQVVGAS